MLPFAVTAVEVIETALDEQLVKVHLEACFLEDGLLNRSVGDEPQDDHFSLLADSVSPVLSLQVHLRIPIRIEQNDSISSLQVEPQATGPSAEQEDVVFRVLFVEHLRPLPPFVGLGASVEPQVLDALVVEVDLHNVHEMGHLREDEHPVAELLEFWKQPVDELELSRGAEDPVVVADVVVVSEEHVGMVAAFSQLHHQVSQGRSRYLA